MIDRVLLASLLAILPGAFAHDDTDVLSVAKNSLASGRCGSLVILHCAADGTDNSRDTVATPPAQLDENRWMNSGAPNEIVIRGERVTKATIGAVFERNLGAGALEKDAVTRDKGAGVRCTQMRTGQSVCSRGATKDPGRLVC